MKKNDEPIINVSTGANGFRKKAVEQSEVLFRHLVMQSPSAICIIRKGPDYIAEAANSHYLQIINKTEEELIGKPFFDALPEIREQGIPQLIDQVIETGEPYSGNEYPIEFRGKTGLRKAYFNFTYQPYKNPLDDEEIVGVFVSAWEVTNIVESKHALAESERQFRNMFMQSSTAMAILNGPEFVIALANNSMLDKIWKRKLDDVKGKKILDVFPELVSQPFPAILKKVFESGAEHVDTEAEVIVSAEGELMKLYIDYEYQPLFNIDGSVSGIMVNASDVTERVHASKALAEAEQRSRLAIESTDMGTFVWDLQIDHFKGSPRLSAIFGYPEDIPADHSILLESLHPADLPKRNKAIEQAYENGILQYEARFFTPGNCIKWVKIYGKVIFDQNKKPIKMFGMAIDITEEKTLLLSLEESQNRLSIALNAAKLATYEADVITNKVTCSQSFYQMFDFDDGQALMRNDVLNRMHPDDRAVRNKAHEIALQTGNIEYETRLVLRDDSIRWIKTTGRYIFDETNQPIRILGNVMDITEQKTNILELEQRELLFKTITNTSPVGLWLTNDKNINIFLNNTWIQWTGISLEDQLANGWFQTVDPDDKIEILQAFEAAANKREKFTAQFRFTNADNQIRWGLTEGFPYFSNEGKFEGYAGSVTDITEHLVAMDALKKSEERFRQLANAMPQFIWTADPVGYLNYFNEAIYQYTGLTEDNIYTEGWFNVIHPDDRDRTIEIWVQAIKSGSAFSCEHRYRRYDGEYRWQLSRALPQRDLNSKIQLWIGSSTDIHDQKLASEELERKVRMRTAELQAKNNELIQQKEFVEIIIDSSLVLVTVFDLDKRVISFNRKCETVFSRKKENVIGKYFHEVFPGIEKSQTYINIDRALQGETIHATQYRSTINGSFFESYFVPLRDNRNEIYAVLMTALDITDIVQATEKVQEAYKILEEQNQALERSNHELESFSYVASHDLQEPLRKIQTFVELLHQNLDDRENSDKYFQKITSSAKRMSSLIRDVLNYSKLSSHEEGFTEVDLNKVLEEVKMDFELLITEKKANVTNDTLPVVYGVPLQLSQLFTNLMSNALKFSPGRPQIDIKASTVAGKSIKNIPGIHPSRYYHYISFSDKGIGFEQAFAEKIFTIFQRLNSREYGGTGIGLALCKKIVETHSGSIVAESAPGKGSIFHVYLPFEN